ncbi:hypothetical protein D8B26_004891 [Coccidioides posadasii str. Silveira]|uniref:Uncharacterized protein n=1 Tax=Coccidioides posadasii (strain RMSCC 757 / Silveira) TaxID=443226 RepID=E9D692_COCPS|nr:conserved hypothetical protein [Coccidioides posadasii str. Silveira]QVM10230.1 hypothetical protein D8B26_004891 [Coccidioides posadasii str. Silveira]
MPPNTPGDDSHQKLLDQLDITRSPRPFRNPHWKPSTRRNKNVKQILSESSRKEASAVGTQDNSGTSTPKGAGAAADGTDTSTPVTTGPHATIGTPSGPIPRPTNIAQAAQSLSTLVLEKNFSRSMYAMGPAVTYTNIESAPSLHAAQQKHYCDITGLPAPYKDPKTRLRYHDKEVFGVIRSLGQGVAESYLETRGAHVVLK